MEKKNIKVINKLIIILVLLSIIFPTNIKASETNRPIKGDLRCPLNSNNCTEIKDGNGVVTEVRIVQKDENVEVTKIVKKTTNLGKYEVSFNVKGKNITPIETYKDTKIYLILDTSKSIESAFGNIKTATKKLVNYVKEIENLDIKIIQFASNAKVIKKFGKTEKDIKFYNVDDNAIGGFSYLNKALNEIKEITNDEQKYIIILGDGVYWDFHPKNETNYNYPQTDVSKNEKKLKDLHKKENLQFFMIQYASSLTMKDSIDKSNKWIKNNIKPTKWWCNFENNGVYSYHSNCVNSKKISYDTIFDTIFDTIKNEVKVSNKSMAVNINDKIGSEFYLEDSTERTKTLVVNSVTQTGVSSLPFYITIDEYAEDGWHETNDGFTLTYKINEEEKKIVSNGNPEVYWIQEKKVINSCSGITTFDTIKDTDTSGYGYYEKICQEGYLKNNHYIEGFKTSIKINNLANGVKSFDILAGLGFPANINLSTNLMCQYKFDYTKYNIKYQDILNKLRNSRDSREEASLEKEKRNLDRILNNYIDLVNNDFNNYLNRFTSQSATLRVAYNDGTNDQIVEFINNGGVVSDKKCENRETKFVNGKSVVVNQTCYMNLKKDMSLPAVCLNMKTAEQEECNDSNTQLDGGYKFYTELKQKNGNIFIDIKNAGYSSMLNIKLEDCSYTSSGMNIVYRPIDLKDPFLQSYDNNRSIGRNYLNNKYNFVSIIKSDIWDKNFMYRYSMSKTNVEKINRDTNEEGVNSYLGRNCYFTSENKYVCDFTRNKTSNDGVSNQTEWFTKVEINN